MSGFKITITAAPALDGSATYDFYARIDKGDNRPATHRLRVTDQLFESHGFQKFLIQALQEVCQKGHIR